jgi:hypothetical protein
MKVKRNIWYALYNQNDEYIAGFKNIRDMSEFLGNSKPSLASVLCRDKKNRGEVTKTFVNEDEDMTCDCSQKIYSYTNNIKNYLGKDLGKYCTLFKFWEEKP